MPVDANLPRDYIARDDVRMEAYRRLAAVTTPADVDDVRAEWEDRYGPPPPPAEALLDVARLRAECLRLGIRAVSVQKGNARLDGWQPLKSQEARLKMKVGRAQVLPDAVVVPVHAARGLSITQALLRLLEEVAPQTPAAQTPRPRPRRRRLRRYHPPDDDGPDSPPRGARGRRSVRTRGDELLELHAGRGDDQLQRRVGRTYAAHHECDAARPSRHVAEHSGISRSVEEQLLRRRRPGRLDKLGIHCRVAHAADSPVGRRR